MRPKLIIFDMDGLMLDSEALYYRLYEEACAQQSLEPKRSVFVQTIGRGDDCEYTLYKEAHPNGDPDKLLSYIIQKNLECFENGDVPLKPGLFELFDAIDAKGGIKKAVGTSHTSAMAKKILTATGVMQRLDGGVFRDMVVNGKPAPDTFAECCRQFGFSPEDCLVLEDSEAGITAAIQAGVPVIAVPDIVQPRAELREQCFACCESLFDVIKYL